MTLPPDPSLKDLQLPWEKQFWYKDRSYWKTQAEILELLRHYFSDDRKPRDIFRNDVAEFREWLRKKGHSNNHIHLMFERYGQFYRFLNDLEVVEKDWNPFEGMAPRRIRA